MSTAGTQRSWTKGSDAMAAEGAGRLAGESQVGCLKSLIFSTRKGNLRMKAVHIAIAILVVAIPRLATAQGLPARVETLEKKVNDLENNRALLEPRVNDLESKAKILEQRTDDLGKRLKELDEATGLVRTLRESYRIVAGTGLPTPKPIAFGNRSLIAAVVTAGSGPPVVVLANTQVAQGDCARFQIQDNTLTMSAIDPICNAFEVLYIYTGLRL